MPCIARKRTEAVKRKLSGTIRRWDVIVVGAGPVGCTAAILLADAGMQVAIVDDQWHPYPFPREDSVDRWTLALLRRVLGLNAEQLVFKHAAGCGVYLDKSRLDRPFSKSPDQEAGWRVSIDQPQLEDLLRAAIERHERVAEFFGVSARLLENGSAPSLTVEDVITGEQGVMHATYLLGCDGAAGFVRAQLNVPVRTFGENASFLVVDADAPSGSLAGTSGELHQIADYERPVLYTPTGLQSLPLRCKFGLRVGEDALALRTPEQMHRLLAPFTSEPHRLSILRHSIYTCGSRIAQKWRSGNVFLCGDAAATFPPYIAGGLSIGVRNVHSLCDKLELVWRGMAGPELLDRFQQECYPLAERHILASERLGASLWARAAGSGGLWSVPWSWLALPHGVIEAGQPSVVAIEPSRREAPVVAAHLARVRVHVPAQGSGAASEAPVVRLVMLQPDHPKLLTRGVANNGELEALQALPDSVRPRVFAAHSHFELSGTSSIALRFVDQQEQQLLFGRATYVVVLSNGRVLGRYASGEEAALVAEYRAAFGLKPPAASELALARARAVLLAEVSHVDLNSLVT